MVFNERKHNIIVVAIEKHFVSFVPWKHTKEGNIPRSEAKVTTAGLEPATFGSEDQCSTIEPGGHLMNMGMNL